MIWYLVWGFSITKSLKFLEVGNRDCFKIGFYAFDFEDNWTSYQSLQVPTAFCGETEKLR